MGRRWDALSQTLGYWAVGVPDKYQVDTVMKHWPEEHGKSLCDGKFGHLSSVTARASLTTILSDASELRRAWEKGHQEDAEHDPSCARSTFIHFEPPRKSELPKHILDCNAIGARINSSYMWSATRRREGAATFGISGQPRAASNINLRDHVLPGRHAEGCTPILRAADLADVNEPWRRAKRDEEPEKAPAPLHKIKSRYSRQFQNQQLPSASRHRPLFLRLAVWKRTQALRLAKEKLQRSAARAKRLASSVLQ